MCFFCKQKTAYEMRISDWSSDVCSSDLIRARDDASSAARTSALAAGRTAPVAIAPVKYDLGASVGFEKFVTPSLPRGTDLRNLPVARAPEQEEQKRSEEHTSELQSLMRISYAVFCLKKKHKTTPITNNKQQKY